MSNEKLKKMFSEINEKANCLQKDHDAFQQGNASAGTRLRSTLQEVKKIAQEMRISIQEIKNENKIKA